MKVKNECFASTLKNWNQWFCIFIHCIKTLTSTSNNGLIKLKLPQESKWFWPGLCTFHSTLINQYFPTVLCLSSCRLPVVSLPSAVAFVSWILAFPFFLLAPVLKVSHNSRKCCPSTDCIRDFCLQCCCIPCCEFLPQCSRLVGLVHQFWKNKSLCFLPNHL